MMGAFSQLENEWRSERQMTGIRKAQEKGVYRNRVHHRRRETKMEVIDNVSTLKLLF